MGSAILKLAPADKTLHWAVFLAPAMDHTISTNLLALATKWVDMV
jgi:hypothetical protein